MLDIKSFPIPERYEIVSYRVVEDSCIQTKWEGVVEIEGVWERFTLTYNPQYTIFTTADVCLIL